MSNQLRKKSRAVGLGILTVGNDERGANFSVI